MIDFVVLQAIHAGNNNAIRDFRSRIPLMGVTCIRVWLHHFRACCAQQSAVAPLIAQLEARLSEAEQAA